MLVLISSLSIAFGFFDWKAGVKERFDSVFDSEICASLLELW